MLQIGDSFEKEQPYKFYASSNVLTDIRYVEKIPNTEIFHEENRLLNKYTGQRAIASSKSLYLQSAFDFPGKGNCFLKSHEPLLLKGRLLEVSIWVHSQKYPHHLYLIFLTKQKKYIAVSLGKLLWKGWRRLHIPIPKKNFQVTRIIGKNSDYYFLGFKIISSPYSSSGAFSLLFDNLLFLVDPYHKVYHGSEIKDNWSEL